MAKKNTRKFKAALGCLPDTPDPRDLILAPAPTILPKQIDYTAEMGPIRNQNPEGTCVGHAAVAVKEFHEKRQYGTYIELSERFIYELAQHYDEWPGSDYEGSSVRGAMKALHKHGVCEEYYWPYQPFSPPNPKPPGLKHGAFENAFKYRILGYRSLGGLDHETGRFRVNLRSVRRAVVESGPVAMSFDLYDGKWFEVGGDGIIDGSGVDKDLDGGHAICIVGYDDDSGRFKIRNSWGASYGDNGYCYISYGYAQKTCVSAWTAWDLTE